MTFEKARHQRLSLRLAGYEYTGPGFYFITICVQEHQSLPGATIDNKIVLNDSVWMVAEHWHRLPRCFSDLALDEFVVMPNHIHGILVLRRCEPCVRPYGKEDGRICTKGCMQDVTFEAKEHYAALAIKGLQP